MSEVKAAAVVEEVSSTISGNVLEVVTKESFARLDGEQTTLPVGSAWQLVIEKVTTTKLYLRVLRAGDPIEIDGVVIGYALNNVGADQGVLAGQRPARTLPEAPSPVALAWAAKVF